MDNSIGHHCGKCFPNGVLIGEINTHGRNLFSEYGTDSRDVPRCRMDFNALRQQFVHYMLPNKTCCTCDGNPHFGPPACQQPISSETPINVLEYSFLIVTQNKDM
jgi:hypothetical protein